MEVAIFSPVLLLYPPQNTDFQVLVASLKESLREALVVYYPFAGRLVKKEGTNGELEVRCDDSGCFFTEAVVEETLEEVGGAEGCVDFTGMEAAGLSGDGIFSLNEHEEIPPLVIQVTSFKCKSIALAVNWHHQVVDGVSGMSFLKAWSELALGLPITCRPDHRRHLLSPRVPPQPSDSIPGCKLLSSHPQEQESSLLSEVRWSKEATVELLPKKVEFTISAEEIQQLKKEASTSGASFASGVLISAHLWRLVTKARGLDRDATTTIYTVVDARKRLKDFPVNYFGNCIFYRPADCSVADMFDMPLGHVAKLIQDSVSVVTEDYVRSIVDFVHVTGALNLTWERPNLSTHDVQPTFWRFFPIYELDFGFGIPRYGGRNSPILGSTGFAVVCPTPSGDGSVLITQFLFPDAADSLEAMVKL